MQDRCDGGMIDATRDATVAGGLSCMGECSTGTVTVSGVAGDHTNETCMFSEIIRYGMGHEIQATACGMSVYVTVHLQVRHQASSNSGTVPTPHRVTPR